MLENISTKTLEEELKKRKEVKQEPAPKQSQSFNFEPLQDICQEYIDSVEKDGYANEDFDHYIFETALECIFGKEVWSWVNKKLKLGKGDESC